jgi:biopolymer transport protein ExbD
MITRPLDLASKLRPAPRNLDALFFVNAGLLALFFAFFGSPFVLAPGLGVDFRIPKTAGAAANARLFTHTITVLESGQILTPTGPEKTEGLAKWLVSEAKKTDAPLLLVRASEGTPIGVQMDIASAATRAGFELIMAAEEPAPVRPAAPR